MLRFAWLTGLALLATGCASRVDVKTPAELMAARREAAVVVASGLSVDAAYRKALEQMKGCYERSLGIFGSARSVVSGDRGGADARVWWSVVSAFDSSVWSVISIAPAPGGSLATLYWSGDRVPQSLRDQATLWLVKNGEGCRRGQRGRRAENGADLADRAAMGERGIRAAPQQDADCLAAARDRPCRGDAWPADNASASHKPSERADPGLRGK